VWCVWVCISDWTITSEWNEPRYLACCLARHHLPHKSSEEVWLILLLTRILEPRQGQLHAEPRCTTISCNVASLSWQEPEEELIILLLMKVSDTDWNIKGKNVSCLKLISNLCNNLLTEENVSSYHLPQRPQVPRSHQSTPPEKANVPKVAGATLNAGLLVIYSIL